MRSFGTVARGLRCPIFKEGDNLAVLASDLLISALENEKIELKNGDILAITESVVARTQGNYVHINNIASDVQEKFGKDATVGFVWPITSRNRVANILRGVSLGVKEVVIMLSFPGDEVGNMLVSHEKLIESGISLSEELSEEEFIKAFGKPCHTFTGVNYIEYYKSIAPNAKIIFSNDARHILKHTKNVICADVHSRLRTKKLLLKSGAKKVVCLDEILNKKTNKHGYNQQYGLLGSNLSGEDTLKLFPRDCESLVEKIQQIIKAKTGKLIEVMVYGDGAFKDPVGGIWELYDPVVSPGFTSGLVGKPNELKLKFLADNLINSTKDKNVEEKVKEFIKQKDKDLVGRMDSQGTTPRQLTDLIGSLCDLVSGSGDKGTPIVFIQGYFDNYATE